MRAPRTSLAPDPTWTIREFPLASSERADATASVLVSGDESDEFTAAQNQSLYELFHSQCKELGWREARRRIAIEGPSESLSYAQLDRLAIRTARFLREGGIRKGDRIAILFERSPAAVAAVLALSRLGAAYVPLDTSFPADRIRFILENSGARTVLTSSALAHHFGEDGLSALDVPMISLDAHTDAIARQSARPMRDEPGDNPDPLAYIIYTSGSTGRPKGVPIRNSSLSNFLRVAAKMYGLASSDRVYQGMTLAFDFSIEELFVPLIVGATMVPAPPGVQLVGQELFDFLEDRAITALCCVPTLLATLEGDPTALRFLLVSGEACPPDLIRKWQRPGRRILNAYGPTETTVTATWSLAKPDSALTIGGPLPTYSILILDPDQPQALPPGEVGEIAIGGVALSEGYLDRPELTIRAFIEDFAGLPNNPTGRIYRTGDLGRITDENQVEFLGRIDQQVKIRGYRIELSEIESVVREQPGIGSVVVHPYESGPGAAELVCYSTPAPDGEQTATAVLHSSLRNRLPSYMVPSFFEELPELPLLASGKVDRNALPPPKHQRFLVTGEEFVPPQPGREAALAELLAQLLHVDRISANADFFDELGADSLVLAQFVTRISKQLKVRRVSLRKLYENPSIAALNKVLPEELVSAAEPKTSSLKEPQSGKPTPSRIEEMGKSPHQASAFQRFSCGTLQVVTFLATLWVGVFSALSGLAWVQSGESLSALYLRAVLAGSALFFGTSLALIGVKWIAVGRFKREPIPIWSSWYFRFWLARISIRANPLNLLIGTPLYNVYLRALGAKVGKRAVILARAPTCTDLIEIGDDAVLRQDVFFPGYTAHAGWIIPGPISIGSRTFVGEASVLEIGAVLGDDAQLARSSALLENAEVPAAESYHGSPAEPGAVRPDWAPPQSLTAWRRFFYSSLQLGGITLLTLPVTWFLAAWLGTTDAFAIPDRLRWLASGGTGLVVGTTAIYLGGILSAGAAALVMPRVLRRFMEPERTHPLYGAQYQLARAMTRWSNSRLLNTLFGDSALILHYLSAIGFDLRDATQTGSNFGVDQRHHSPFLNRFGRDTLVSDGLALLNLEVSRGSFALRSIEMPPHTYLGNLLHYPAGARIGENCLIATKAMVPTDGPIREGVGILGSPPFEIPRSVARDRRFDHYKQPGVLEGRLRLKLRSNLSTLGLYMARCWAQTFVAVALASVALNAAPTEAPVWFRAGVLAGVSFLSLASAGLLSILIERLVVLFYPVRPLYCSLYDRAFWNHERFWKLNYNLFLPLLDGTPLKPFILRLQGATIGRGLFDDGAGLTEPALTTVGDYVCLNQHVSLQCHSLEDGTFKSDRIEVGSHCSVGLRGFVHYGTRLEDDVRVEADSFLMKGSTAESGATWRGNPARAIEQPYSKEAASVDRRESTCRSTGDSTC